MSSENRVDEQTAGEWFDSWAETVDIDLDEVATMDAEDRTAFNKNKRRIIKALVAGTLVVGDDGDSLVYTPQHSRSTYREPLTFRERSGGALLATDGKGKNKDAAKTYAMLGDICGVHQSSFTKLVGIDIKICEAIFALLMD